MVARLGQRPRHDGVQCQRQLRVEVAGCGWLVRDDLLDQGKVRLGIKGPLARQQLVQHDACSEQISACIDRMALNLLGRHVFERANHRALGAGGLARVLNTGHTKVGQLDATAGFNQQIGGLDVAVNDALLVRIVKRREQVAHDAQGLLQCVDVPPVQVVLEVIALNELHHQVSDVQVTVRVVYADNIGVLQARCGARFSAKTHLVFGSCLV